MYPPPLGVRLPRASPSRHDFPDTRCSGKMQREEKEKGQTTFGEMGDQIQLREWNQSLESSISQGKVEEA